MKKKRARKTERVIRGNAETQLQYLENRRRIEEKLRANETRLERIKEIMRVHENILHGVKALVRFAKDGDTFAGLTLVKVATAAVAELNDLVEKQPTFLPFSRKIFAWPAFVSRKRFFSQSNKKLLDLLQVDKGGIFSEREWQISAPSTRVAFGIYWFAHDIAAAGRLPRLTAKTKKRWFDEAWNTLLQDGWKPEEDPRVAGLGKSKATKTPKYGPRFLKRSRDANVRAEIKARVWDAFDKLIVD